MKLLISWLNNNGKCRCWTNGDKGEFACMSAVSFKTAIERIAKEENITFQEAWNKFFEAMEKVQKCNS